MDVIFCSVKWKFALGLLDGIVVISKTSEQHVVHNCEVLSLLQIADVTRKLVNCKFFTGSINYMSHVIRPMCIKFEYYTTGVIKRI